ncbi:amino acid ABC transporter permease [Frisingicoccus caecimuris]|uniref:Amino acid ABC transporter membrane protein (PAAT family) n=1 Tax=Frisingicoccus caecimuris TaxID=1796636 RepID=A0A4R2L3V5_9FIRM|nr:amino acid ABC transporter permease [Frisingicoccus caecimuris]MCR1919902.1 amino acid ABC transporter permease [Frisingicoccus caecimuris]TCO81893.1 amino acid ABC transporter membrane protein (PAAT family) [Frisingicoccus caecimuris]
MAITDIIKQLSSGMGVTIEIFFVTLVSSLILGLGLALVRMSKFKILSILAKIYISIMRGTPLMLQLLVVYFGPYFIFGIPITRSYRLNAVLIGFALNYAAYFAEIYRGGISAIPEGQYEAAKLLGYSRSQTFIHIVMPQVIKRIIPAVANETITLVKDTSLAFTLAVAEIFTLTKQLVASQSSMMPFVVAAVFYYIFNLLVAMFFDHVEKKLSYYR